MSRLMSHAIAAAAPGGVVPGRTAAIGQAPPLRSADASRGATIGTGTFTAFVENMDCSLAFYPFAPCDGCTSRTPAPVR
jgi:hypothetical protein